MPRWLPRRARAGVAVGLALALAALSNSAALADQVRNQEWWLRALDVTRAWESSHGSGVTVAVLDTGVDATQPDLKGSVISGPDFTRSGRTPGQPLWGVHGTEVASLIAGHGHGAGNYRGIVGIAPAAKILSVRVTLEANDPLLKSPAAVAGLPGAIARGIDYAVRHGASVIDLPLDPVIAARAPGPGGGPAERAAVASALKHHVVLVAPAGDNGAGTDAANYPAAYPGVISVGAFNAHFVKAPFSNRQPYVTLTAAGEGVTAAGPAGYATLNSTSAASAMVAGVVALIRALFPDFTPAQVARALTHSTRFRHPGGRSDGSGYGVVDAAGALAAAARMVEAVPKATISAGAPPSLPAAPTPAATRSLSRTLALDAGFAGAILLLLLGLIFLIRAFRRRRARSARLAEVRAAAQVPVRRPAEPAAAVNELAGFIPAPLADAPGLAAAGSGQAGFGTSRMGLPGVKPPEAVAAAGTLPAAPLPFRLPHTSSMIPGGVPRAGSSPASSGAPPAAFPASAFPDPARAPGESAAEEVPAAGTPGFGGAARAFGAQRMGTVRRPAVSGSPPWAPAPEPNTELPWNQAPAPHVAGPRPLPRRSPPAEPPKPAWDAIAEEEWPGGPRLAAPYPPAAPATGGGTAGSQHGGPGPAVAPPTAGEDPSRERPSYAWPPEPGGTLAGPGGAPDREGGTVRGTPPWESPAAPGMPPWEPAPHTPPWEDETAAGRPPWVSEAAGGKAPWETGASALPPRGAKPGGRMPWENTDTMPAVPASTGNGPYTAREGSRPSSGAGPAGDTTGTFSAFSFGGQAEGQHLSSESTETFPAVPHGEGGAAREDG